MAAGLACREIGVSAATNYKWRQRSDGMSVDDAKLKRFVAGSE